MKVRELMEKLSKLDPDLTVAAYTEDPDLLAEGHMTRVLEASDVTEIEGEIRREDSGYLSIKFGSGPRSTKWALIDVTTDT